MTEKIICMDKASINMPPNFETEWARLTTKVRKLYGEEQLKKVRLAPHREENGPKEKHE